MDTVELLIAFEDGFGIRIPDAVAEQLETPARVIDYVWSLQQGREVSVCLEHRAFNRLRAAFVAEGACARRDFRRESNLGEMVPRRGRRVLWKKLAAGRGVKLPELVRPARVVRGLAGIVVAVAGFVAVVGSGSGPAMVVMFGCCGVGCGVLAGWMSRPLANRFPLGMDTPGALAGYWAAHAPAGLTGPAERLSREQIAATVKRLTLEFCDEHDYREDAHFVHDMGLD